MVRASNAGEMANEFYIVLSGEIGIYLLRLDEVIAKEVEVLNSIRSMIKKSKLGNDLLAEQLDKVVDMRAIPQDHVEFVQGISRITETRVFFNTNFLKERLGDLPDETLLYEGFYNAVT